MGCLDGVRVRWAVLIAVAVLASLLVLLWAARPSAAFGPYQHGTAQTCASCHPGGDTGVRPTDAECVTCHTGGFQSRPGGTDRTCWSCHAPGEDMSASQTSDGCATGAATGACHGGAAHYGSTARGCTSCHGVTLSATDPGASAHHSDAAFGTPSCEDCHETLHAEYVPAVACTDCHVGMALMHPSGASMDGPVLRLKASPRIVTVGRATVLSGTLARVVGSKTTPVAGSKLTLQGKTSETDYANLAFAATKADGSYRFAGLRPVRATKYRVVSTGVASGSAVILPARTSVTVQLKPVLTLTLGAAVVRRGAPVKATVRVAPARPGGAVAFLLQRRSATGRWGTARHVAAVLGASSARTVVFRALKRGSYRVHASAPATAELVAATTTWKRFVVR